MKRLLILTACLVLLLCACGKEDAVETDGHMAVQSSPAVSEEERKPPEENRPENKSEPVPVDPSLEALRQEMGEDFCGIALLGRLPEGTSLEDFLAETGAFETHPFLADIGGEAVIRHEGAELYCLVPKAQGDKLEVYEWICNEENQYQGEAGDLLYESESGAPVILIGNASDVIPNLLVILTDIEGTTLEYSPSLSLCDGSVDLPVSPPLYDFSRYDVIGVAQ